MRVIARRTFSCAGAYTITLAFVKTPSQTACHKGANSCRKSCRVLIVSNNCCNWRQLYSTTPPGCPPHPSPPQKDILEAPQDGHGACGCEDVRLLMEGPPTTFTAGMPAVAYRALLDGLLGTSCGAPLLAWNGNMVPARTWDHYDPLLLPPPPPSRMTPRTPKGKTPERVRKSRDRRGSSGPPQTRYHRNDFELWQAAPHISVAYETHWRFPYHSSPIESTTLSGMFI